MEPRLEEDRLRTQFATLPVLETQRLILRRIGRRDAKDIFAYASDPEVARHVLWTPHSSIRDSRRYVRWMKRQYRNGDPSSFAIELKETGRMIGTIGFVSCSPEDGLVEVGYSIGREHWGRGYTTEALRTVLDFAFTELGVYRVEGRYEWDNPASGRVMEKCGMRLEGTLRGAVFNKGRHADVCVRAILR